MNDLSILQRIHIFLDAMILWHIGFIHLVIMYTLSHLINDVSLYISQVKIISRHLYNRMWLFPLNLFCPFIHLFIHPSIHSFTHPSIHTLNYLPTYLLLPEIFPSPFYLHILLYSTFILFIRLRCWNHVTKDIPGSYHTEIAMKTKHIRKKYSACFDNFYDAIFCIYWIKLVETIKYYHCTWSSQ